VAQHETDGHKICEELGIEVDRSFLNLVHALRRFMNKIRTDVAVSPAIPQLLLENLCHRVLLSFLAGEDSVGRRVHPEKRSVSWVNSVLRQFLPHGPTAGRYFPVNLYGPNNMNSGGLLGPYRPQLQELIFSGPY
jgi:hypothetical protein